MANRIVVGVDSSAASLAALRWAYARASSDGQDLLALHIFDVADRDAAGLRSPYASGHDVSQLTQARVLAALPDLDDGVQVTISTPSGSLLSSLVEAAQEAVVVVVGEPQCAAHAALPEQLSAACPCPVVQVSENGTARPLSGDHAYAS